MIEKKLCKTLKDKNGITLITLVITIIILLILVGVAISIGLNEGNLFGKANEAKTSWNISVEEENTILSRYWENITQYTGDMHEEPITGTLNVGYTLLADNENTYKKVTLDITGLAKAEPDELYALVAEAWENNGYDGFDYGGNWDGTLDGLKAMLDEEGLASEIEYYGINDSEKTMTTVTLNGSSIPTNKNEFLATQNGTYNVTVRSASNKVGTINILIDGTKIGVTEEQTGINEEIFAEPANYDYTDSNNKYARIPVGYYVGTSSEINTIENGLVITSSIDASGHSTGDEYVWIPLEDYTENGNTINGVNKMVMCKNRTDSNECNIDFVDGVLKCKNHSETGRETNLCGKFYDTVYSQTWDEDGTRNREPDILNGYEKSDSISEKNYMETAGITDRTVETLKNQLTNDFYEMAKSVARYKGFWIARYEAGISGGSKKAQLVANGYENNNLWYGLYRISRNIDSTNKIAKTMIWGSQYDQVIKFIGNEAKTTHGGALLKETSPSAYAIGDKMRNIFDLEGNLWEWTAEASNTNFRTIRGNNSFYVANSNLNPASARLGFAPDATRTILMYSTSRATLYVML